jgi:hypothetical protein
MGSRLHAFYNSNAFQAVKTRLMLERGMTCEHCGGIILSRHDCVPHHVTELTEDNVDDPEVALADGNIKLVHFRCHNRLHERFGQNRRRVYLVWGSPCAGKTAWVNASCNPDDLIADIDAAWRCVCAGGKDKPNRMKQCAFGLHGAILDMVRTRVGQWRNAYIVGTYPAASERERLCSLFGAEPVHIGTDKDTCLERCGDDEARRGWVEEYWSRYVPPR